MLPAAIKATGSIGHHGCQPSVSTPVWSCPESNRGARRFRVRPYARSKPLQPLQRLCRHEEAMPDDAAHMRVLNRPFCGCKVHRV